MSERTLNLNQKIVEIRRVVDYLKKETKGFKGSFVSGSQILAKIRKRMDELGVLIYPCVKNSNLDYSTYIDKKDGVEKLKHLYIYTGDGAFIIRDSTSEEVIEVPWYFAADQDKASYAFGHSMTYSERYFFMKFFNVPTDKDDPETFKQRNKVKSGEFLDFILPLWEQFSEPMRENIKIDFDFKDIKEMVKREQDERTEFYYALENRISKGLV